MHFAVFDQIVTSSLLKHIIMSINLTNQNGQIPRDVICTSTCINTSTNTDQHEYKHTHTSQTHKFILEYTPSNHTNIHSNTYTLTCHHICTCIRMYTYVIHRNLHTHTHTHSFSRRRTQIHSNTNMNSFKHHDVHTHVHTCVCVHIYTHIHDSVCFVYVLVKFTPNMC